MSANEQQAEHWNGSEDGHWVAHADRYDRQLAPFADALFERIKLTPSDRILDVGCGCGATTIAAANFASRAVGVDLSQAMLAVARERARTSGLTNTEFMLADAQTYPFESESFDIVISRFGVMFFDDTTAAFANLRSSMVAGGRLAFVCWQPLEANEWLLVPGLAAAQHVVFPISAQLTDLACSPLPPSKRSKGSSHQPDTEKSASNRSLRKSRSVAEVTLTRPSTSS
jgi:SAM-dependent methyltransferase